MTTPAANAIIWFRRDLRSTAHAALTAAAKQAHDHGGTVTALFVLDDRLLASSGPNRLAMLFGALRALRQAGVPLTVVHGDPAAEVPRLSAALSADVYLSADFGPYGTERDRRVIAAVTAMRQACHTVDSPYVVPPGVVRKGDGTAFSVFTPFKRVWVEHAKGQRPTATPSPSTIAWSPASGGGTIPPDPETSAVLPSPTEAAAATLIERFFAGPVDDYVEDRNLPAVEGTSRLGTYLKYGIVHPRQLLDPIERAIAAGNSGAVTFLSELCWREFYADVLFRRPDTARENFASTMDLPTDSGSLADARFDAWTQGRTGFPFIDAGMRQLVAQGWMHNRVRMATASFLVKDLHLPWQRGARWFMQHLIDGDLASNQHGWQWTAGTGTDAAPYFRVFNPVLQGKKFDPDGRYITRWVPELAGVSGPAIHEPWLHRPRPTLLRPTLFPESGADSGAASGTAGLYAYPHPIVDHATERDESLRRLKSIKGR